MTYLENRISAGCAFFGGVLLGIGTSMYPMQTDPNDAAAVFTEYAAHNDWIVAHLLQFAGLSLLIAFMLLLARDLIGTFAGLRPLASGGAIACLALVAALQAVEGVALKASVDAWAAASAADKPAAFAAAFAVRQIDIGLASVLSMLFGATAAVFGLMIHGDGRYPVWIGGVAFASGIGFAIGGVVMANTGFASTVMDIQMPASLLLLTWIVAVAAILWRRSQTPVLK
jgi:hypothetical protein